MPRDMVTLHQSPTDPEFVQNPYPFYARARDGGPLHLWADYGMQAAFRHDAVHALLRDRRFGREKPAELRQLVPDHLARFDAVERHSMLDAEPPRHTRLRGLVLRAFTSRRIAGLEPEIEALCHHLIDTAPSGPFDLLETYCSRIPVLIIARLLGVPEEMWRDLLRWSHDMVAMYQAGRTRAIEEAADQSAAAFAAFLRGYIDQRRTDPRDDLITQLIAAEENGEKLSTDELIGTCVLLLNAGHEATVHGLGNGVKTLLETGTDPACLAPDQIDGTVEEILRYDPPLHMFTRFAYEDVELFGHQFRRGEEVALMLGAANRDPAMWTAPDQFDPSRPITTHTSFGAGLHFCVGAPLARLEMAIGLKTLLARCPNLALAGSPTYSNTYHFHGLTALMVTK